MNGKRMPRWPLFVIALPAAVAVWSGWVGLGQLCGFGIIHPLPGIWDAAHLNTAITLPVGVEAYGSYALAAWLDSRTPEAARKFAKRSAVGSLVLGMAGQVCYHLLAAAHATRAPWPVVVLVSSLPVVVLGFGAALSHLLREADDDAPAAVTTPATPMTGEAVSSVPEDVPVTVPTIALVGVPVDEVPTPAASVAETVPAKRAPRRPASRAAKSPERLFAAEIETNTVPSIRAIKDRAHVGTDKARAIRDQLARLIAEAEPEAA